MRRIAIINQKGGVGKTTSCCNVGAAMAAAGRRVLLIDLDPQANLTMHLGHEPDSDKPSIYDVLTDNVPVAEATLQVRENLWLIPSHIDLAAAEMELVSVMGREVILRDALAAADQSFDFVLIDCPPSLGVLTINGLAAMEEVFVPMQPHFLALQGVGKLLETIRLVKDRINPQLSLTGIILCMYEAGTRLAGEVSADLAGFLEESRGTDAPWADAVVFSTIIRRNIKLAECPSHGLTIAEYAARSNGAQDYAALTAEILGVELASIPFPAANTAKSDAIENPKEEETATAADTGDAQAETGSVDTVPDNCEADATAPVNPVPDDDASAFDAGDRAAFGPDDMAVPAAGDTEASPASVVAAESDEATDDSKVMADTPGPQAATVDDDATAAAPPEQAVGPAGPEYDEAPAVPGGDTTELSPSELRDGRSRPQRIGPAKSLSIPIAYEEDDESASSPAEAGRA
jgi:chromosome partitioning protein